jgi:cellulose biosynthesis protein BcsQ
VESYFELATTLLLATESEADQLILLNELIHQFDVILNSGKLEKAREGARALLESLMLATEDLQAKTSQQILGLLARLSNAPEGVVPPSDQDSKQPKKKRADAKIDNADRALLRNLLQVGLYREVMIFLDQEQHLARARQSAASLENILTPTVSFISRKGGVGKSILSLATAAWYSKYVKARATVCIIDLDFSGPVWQYLLFPERQDKPSHFLNDLFSLDQGNQKGEFEFPPKVSTDQIKPFLEKSSISIEGTRLSLLSIADLPRTSRFLSIAIDNNIESFFRFLTQLLVALQPLVDLVIIDNSPGLGTLPLLSHLIATSVRHGCSTVVSTPALHDMWGTIIELSDLSVLDQQAEHVNRPPLWIINKADERARQFLSTKHKIVDVAQRIGAYNRILPHRPLIERAVSSSGLQFSGLALPLTPALLAFGNIRTRWGKQPLQNEFTTFLKTDFFKAFVKYIAPVMLPLLTDGLKQKRTINVKS